MTSEPRFRADYSGRQIEAARRVIVDVGQVLGSFRDCIVLVGGWVPDFLFDEPEERHIGSIDVDLALDAKKLFDGRYAELLQMLLDTDRYAQGSAPFRFVTDVPLNDGLPDIQVEVDFLASKEIRIKGRRPRLLDGFRVQQADGCTAAFRAPQKIVITGNMASGAKNSVEIRVAALPDFIIMKAFALGQRDKPKDAYDICYCLGQVSDLSALAQSWRDRRGEADVVRAIAYLDQKFSSVDSFGPRQVVLFQDSSNPEEPAMVARRAYELVREFLRLVEGP